MASFWNWTMDIFRNRSSNSSRKSSDDFRRIFKSFKKSSRNFRYALKKICPEECLQRYHQEFFWKFSMGSFWSCSKAFFKKIFFLSVLWKIPLKQTEIFVGVLFSRNISQECLQQFNWKFLMRVFVFLQYFLKKIHHVLHWKISSGFIQQFFNKFVWISTKHSPDNYPEIPSGIFLGFCQKYFQGSL